MTLGSWAAGQSKTSLILISEIGPVLYPFARGTGRGGVTLPSKGVKRSTGEGPAKGQNKSGERHDGPTITFSGTSKENSPITRGGGWEGESSGGVKQT